jgi:hypothetical protein
VCHLQSLGFRLSVQKAEAGNVSTGPVEAGNQADFDRIAGNDEDGRYRRGRGLGCVAAMATAAARLLRAYASQVETLRRLKNGGSKLEHDSNDTEHALVCGSCWCSLECQGNDPTGGPRGIGPLHFISGERNSSLLIGTAPVRKRTMFNFDQKVIARY